MKRPTVGRPERQGQVEVTSDISILLTSAGEGPVQALLKASLFRDLLGHLPTDGDGVCPSSIYPATFQPPANVCLAPAPHNTS